MLRASWLLVALFTGFIGACGTSAPVQNPANATASAPRPSEVPSGAKGEPSSENEVWAGEEAALSNTLEKPAEATVSARDLGEVAARVKENRKPVRDCYKAAAKEQPGLAGEMVMAFVISPSGKVKTAELNSERSTLKEPSVVACAVRVLSAIDFGPSPNNKETLVNYPYNLGP